jgi:hypothetical protein
LNVSAPARTTAAALGLLLLAACASPRATDKGRPAPAASAAPPAATTQHDAAADASLDWHPLVAAPFGTRLVDSPIHLHEVLLFREQSQWPAEIESKECYAADGTAPAFAGRAPEEFLMCFEHDRLDRIEAMVRIEAERAAGDFERACTLWLGNAQWPGHAQPPAADDACEGRDGDTAFSARLVSLPGEATAELHLTLSDAASRDAQAAPPPDPNLPSPAAP